MNYEHLPGQCGNPTCRFHTEPLVWCDKPLRLYLFRIDNTKIKSSDNVGCLCPMCYHRLFKKGV
jgi:hypothetical protein